MSAVEMEIFLKEFMSTIKGKQDKEEKKLEQNKS